MQRSLLSSPDSAQALHSAETTAEQSASLLAARLLLCGPTGCSQRDSRACAGQSNRLQSIRRCRGRADVAKCATVRRGELPAALRQSRLHSISTGDNRALIVWDNKSHRECANAIGWAHLTYAQQNDIWQLVTFLPQMLIRLCFGTARGADPAQRSSFGGEQSERQQRSPASPGLLVPPVLLAVLSRRPASEALPLSQSPGHAEKHVQFINTKETDSHFISSCPLRLGFYSRMDHIAA